MAHSFLTLSGLTILNLMVNPYEMPVTMSAIIAYFFNLNQS